MSSVLQRGTKNNTDVQTEFSCFQPLKSFTIEDCGLDAHLEHFLPSEGQTAMLIGVLVKEETNKQTKTNTRNWQVDYW